MDFDAAAAAAAVCKLNESKRNECVLRLLSPNSRRPLIR